MLHILLFLLGTVIRGNILSLLKISQLDINTTQQAEKRKWQLALRRYIIEGSKSFAYAKYFGLSASYFKQWIEKQLPIGLNWEDYTTKWQLDHVVPLVYFDFTSEEDLKIAWSFLNIRPEATVNSNTHSPKVDILAARKYFSSLYESTQNELCSKMLDKIEQIEHKLVINTYAQIALLKEWEWELSEIKNFDNHDYDQWNSGISIQKIIEEKQLLKKMGL
jgi:hypothetical protein